MNFLNVLNNYPTEGIMSKSKPRGSFNLSNISRPQIAVDRMDSIKSTKSPGYVDPFIRTNQALLKRLDSLGSVFTKMSNNAARMALSDSRHGYNIPTLVSQASKHYGRDTPGFRMPLVSKGTMEDDRATFDGWDANSINNGSRKSQVCKFQKS